jgi:single-strand DNA-binding protein
MSQGGYVTLIGFVAREPNLRTTKNGRMVADVRVGATTRFFDKMLNDWRDGETSYYTVNCWRRLAEHVRASLHKGDPVMVRGRFRTYTYEDKQNRIRTEVEIVADTIGHDLSRGVANYMRPDRAQTRGANGNDAGAGASADVDAAGAAGGASAAGGSGAAGGADPDDLAGPDDMDLDGPAAAADGSPFADFGADPQQAADELGRELDKGFTGDGQLAGSGQPVAGGLEAQRATEPVPEESREPAGASVPF